jgi:hypothetical protein
MPPLICRSMRTRHISSGVLPNGVATRPPLGWTDPSAGGVRGGGHRATFRLSGGGGIGPVSARCLADHIRVAVIGGWCGVRWCGVVATFCGRR